VERAHVNDIEIAWTQLGAGDPPIVVVPQWFLSSRSTVASPLVKMLAERHRLIVYDRRGTGASGKPGPPYNATRDARDLVALLGEISSERVVLLGLGVRGTHVALHVAGQIPDRVHAVVCIGGTPKWAASAEWPYGIQAGTFHKAFEISEDAIDPPGMPPDDPALADAMREDWRAAAPHATDILNRTLDEDLRPYLSRVVSPTLIVHLRGDPLVQFEAARWLAESLPGGQLEVFDAGREVPLRAPEELAKHIDEFVTVTAR
jgi:pimeloyl-ACP methyl ester carboxylesterase